jgi:cysteinyl-tRNA synthetase
MSLRFYNTLTRKTEDFVPLEAGRVRMYNCGPTVYSTPTIGNFRTFLFADLLRRHLEYRGFAVTQVMNLTDVGHLRDDAEEGEDKLEATARREKIDPYAVAEKYTGEFFQGVEMLRFAKAHHYPRATAHVAQMIAIIETLVAQGYAYVVPSGNVYFEVARFPRYGALSGNSPDELLAGARIEENPEKHDPRDFALWKRDPHHLMQWDSPWGRGFPGWHIECSAMSKQYLGTTLDIHTGGEDNIFPHHECEIAQSEASSGQTFVRYWLHSRFLLVDGGRMGKSLGNFYTIQDILAKGFSGTALRYMLIRANYRQQLNFTMEGMAEAQRTVDRLHATWRKLEAAAREPGPAVPEIERAVAEQRREFGEAMDDDLNISRALAALHEIASLGNRSEARGATAQLILDAFVDLDRVVGVLRPDASAEVLLPDAIQALVDQREAARKARDFAAADRIRKELLAQGVVLEDTKEGVRWKRARVE